MQLERNMKTNSNSLDGRMKFGEMPCDIKEMEISSEKVVIPEKKTKVLIPYHISQHQDKYVSTHHMSIKKQPLIRYHYGKYGHTRPFVLLH